MRPFSPSTHSFFPILLLFTTTFRSTAAQSNPNPILTSSFTWNPTCGPTVACGPSAAGYHGTGFAASNNLTYAGCTNLGDDTVDCNSASLVSGVGKGCGQCWHITPQSDWFPSNGLSVGTSVVVKINDQCTDAGYCDQTVAHPVNTGYGKEVHIDLCAESGVTGQFFGAVGPGVVVGLAQLLPDCSALDDGPYGSGLGSLDGSSSASSSSSGSSAASSNPDSESSPSATSDSSSSSGSDSSASSGSDSSSSTASDSSSTSGSVSSPSSASDSSSSSGSDSSSSSSAGSDSSSSSGSDSSSSSSSGSDSSPSSGSDSSSSSSSESGSSSSSGSDSSSNSGSDSSSNSGSDSSSNSNYNSNSDASSSSNPNNAPSSPDTVSSGSGNWSWSGPKIAAHKLSSGHDGAKAGADVVVSGASNAGSNDSGGASLYPSSSSDSLQTPTMPTTPTTLVAVVSTSSTETAPVISSSVGVDGFGQDGDEDDEDCDDGVSDEL